MIRGLNFAFLAIPLLLKPCWCSCTIFSFRSLGNPSGLDPFGKPFQIHKIQAMTFFFFLSRSLSFNRKRVFVMKAPFVSVPEKINIKTALDNNEMKAKSIWIRECR